MDLSRELRNWLVALGVVVIVALIAADQHNERLTRERCKVVLRDLGEEVVGSTDPAEAVLNKYGLTLTGAHPVEVVEEGPAH